MGSQRHVLNDQQLATTIVCTAWSLTVGGVSNPRPLAEPTSLGTTIDPEIGAEIEEPEDREYASVANAVVGA